MQATRSQYVSVRHVCHTSVGIMMLATLTLVYFLAPQASLKCLAMCVSLQHLPGLPAAAVSAGKAVSSLLRKVPDAAHPLAQDCFRLLGGV
jgi:hypothetical protein